MTQKQVGSIVSTLFQSDWCYSYELTESVALAQVRAAMSTVNESRMLPYVLDGYLGMFAQVPNAR